MQTFLLKEEMFCTKVRFFIGDIENDAYFVEDTLRAQDPNFRITDINLPTEGATAKCWDCGHNQIIWLSAAKVELAVHELVHAAFHIADSVGFGDHFSAQEFHAYYVQWAMRKFIRKVKKLGIDPA